MADPQMSPGQWLEFLNRKLDEQCDAIEDPIAYYNGVQRLAFATAKFKEAFSRYFPPLANNWMKLCVDTPVSRLSIEGFRFNPDPTKPGWDQTADQEAWSIWQANNLDSGSLIAHTEAIKCGVCNVLIAPPDADGEEPVITIEHPMQTYVQCSYGNRHRRLAAIKRWVDEIDGYAYAYIYLPKYIYRFRSTKKIAGDHRSLRNVQWTSGLPYDPVSNNPIGVVPMVPIENNPDLIHGGRSDLEVAIPIQDAVNKLCLDMQVSSEYHAYPQRWASGWEAVNDPQGRSIPAEQVEMRVGQSRLIRAASPDTKFGAFTPGEVDNYIKPIEMYIDHLAAITQTPAYYLKGKMANLSADALHAADAGLVDRCHHKILSFSDGWEEVMRVAFLAKNDTKRGKATQAEALWKSPETISLAQVVDAAVKMRTSLSVPVEMCWEMMGWSQQKILQAKKMMGLPDSPAGRKELDKSQPTPGQFPFGQPGLQPGQSPPQTPQTVPNSVTRGGLPLAR